MVCIQCLHLFRHLDNTYELAQDKYTSLNVGRRWYRNKSTNTLALLMAVSSERAIAYRQEISLKLINGLWADMIACIKWQSLSALSWNLSSDHPSAYWQSASWQFTSAHPCWFHCNVHLTLRGSLCKLTFSCFHIEWDGNCQTKDCLAP